ncbi:stage III sporulation protein AE [Mechercharimyces sp. CAU 1602]|uniref:stage III sporulation protein AE n=1 Tax=Mechercharimyces sp. CAU 1602 TaxID=2973933 RepID=UPI002163659C|nr:stage III sporulation protein AE [Mechercharimyces sp. CAU 1602]MCS1350775.1 stage III sporulation protein AE [Mechercharimyces sp. CAU 1602]
MSSRKTITSLFGGLILLFMLWPSISWATTEDPPPPGGPSIADEVVREQFQQLQTEEIEDFWKEIQSTYDRYLPEESAPTLYDLVVARGEGEFSWKEVGRGFIRFFFHELLYNGKLIGTIVVLTVFSMILQTLQTAFERNQVSNVAYAIAYMVIIILAIQSFSVAVDSAKSAISQMIDFMVALVPLILTLLATMGNVGTVALFHPLIVFMIHAVGTVIYTVVFPLFFFAAILHIVSGLSQKYQVNQLAGFMQKIGMSLLGGMLTIFLGIISVQGATAAVADGVTLRTAKYVTGNFVPVVGRVFSDAADTVLGASLLVKNAVGITGVLLLLFICAFPAIKILSLAFIYNFSAALLQPLGNSPIIGVLNVIGKTLIYIFAALATVGLMFFLAITIMITAGNITVMMR